MNKRHCDNCDAIIKPPEILLTSGGTRISRRVNTQRGLNVEAWATIVPTDKNDLCRDCHLEVVRLYLKSLEDH